MAADERSSGQCTSYVTSTAFAATPLTHSPTLPHRASDAEAKVSSLTAELAASRTELAAVRAELVLVKAELTAAQRAAKEAMEEVCGGGRGGEGGGMALCMVLVQAGSEGSQGGNGGVEGADGMHACRRLSLLAVPFLSLVIPLPFHPPSPPPLPCRSCGASAHVWLT